jgi:hypothetical protein
LEGKIFIFLIHLNQQRGKVIFYLLLIFLILVQFGELEEQTDFLGKGSDFDNL